VFNTLFDPGAFNAVDFNFVLNNKLEMIKLPRSMPIELFDGSSNGHVITHGARVPVQIGHYAATVPCLICPCSPKFPVVFGMQWFRSTYPEMVHELLKLGGGENSSPTIS
jgi:hypothetical protein